MLNFLKKLVAPPIVVDETAPPEIDLGTIHRKIKHIEILTRRITDEVFAGQYHTNFKGRGMEFAEVREYSVGDDTRNIDWNVTARHAVPYVKTYQEERELTVFLLIDGSGSFHFGTRTRTKAETCAEIAALLAFSAIKNNDKVGALLFSDQIEKFIPPEKGTRHVLRVIQDILTTRPSGRGTDLKKAFEFFIRAQKKTLCGLCHL